MIRRLVVFVLVLGLSGCSTLHKAQQADLLRDKLQGLNVVNQELKRQHKEELARQQFESDQIISDLREKLRVIADGSSNDVKHLHMLLAKEEAKSELLKKQYESVLSQLQAKDLKLADMSKETVEKISQLELAKNQLQNSLSKELSDYQAKLEMTQRGLVITFLAEIFFESGQAVLKPEAEQALNKVAEILNKEVINSQIAVEGHTDNVPITYSRWASNWELSTARSIAVVEHFIKNGAVKPQRLAAVGYGEYHPVESNDTHSGRAQNRRVEVVILPEQLIKSK